MKVLGTQHCVVVSKKKTLVNFFPLWQFTTFYKWFFFMSVQEKTEPSSWQEEDSWHCIWLTSHNADCNGKVFFFLPQWAQRSIFSVLLLSTPFPSHILTSEVSFICTFLPCQGWAEGGREFLLLTAVCYLSHVLNPSLPTLLLPLLPSFLLPLLELWSVHLCCLFGRCGCEGNTKIPACRHSTTTCWLQHVNPP